MIALPARKDVLVGGRIELSFGMVMQRALALDVKHHLFTFEKYFSENLRALGRAGTVPSCYVLWEGLGLCHDYNSREVRE